MGTLQSLLKKGKNFFNNVKEIDTMKIIYNVKMN